MKSFGPLAATVGRLFEEAFYSSKTDVFCAFVTGRRNLVGAIN